jgi:hypothetical protein
LKRRRLRGLVLFVSVVVVVAVLLRLIFIVIGVDARLRRLVFLRRR